jgi:uncharacterized protein (TIGR02145 family)
MKILFRIVGVTILIFLIHSCKKNDDNAIKDGDGNVYTSVTIGTQVWMVENLKTTKYRNGDLIGTTTTATLDISAEASPKYQWAYGGNESNVATYGRLYTWYTITDTRNVCPTGWHVPTDAEWHTLVLRLDADAQLNYGLESSISGGKLKETGTTYWTTPNTGATNEIGFTALPGGNRWPDGTFIYLGNDGSWWSSTEYNANDAWYRFIAYDDIYVYHTSTGRKDGLSVRCLRDY